MKGMMVMGGINNLVAIYNTTKKDMSEPVKLRIYRCLSWLKKAELSENDLDVKFIALWVAFNAIYAKDIDLQMSDKSAFRLFLQTVNKLAKNELYQLTWDQYSADIRILLDNKYVFQSFWDFHNGRYSESAWLEDFKGEKERVKRSLETQDSESLLVILFSRIYTLRNQIFHGGSTYDSKANRAALGNACQLLEAYTELFLTVILENPHEEEWGKPYYPYIT